jgi:DNA-binding NarL/FixJ family response regulator
MLAQRLGMLSSFRTVEDLHAKQTRPTQKAVQQKLRQRVKIAVVDDKAFEPARNLRSFQYQIQEVDDLKRIDEIAQYPIVLCDLMGVGLSFDEEFQGATLIREIRRNYPATLVVAYSGASQSSEIVKRAKQFSDRFISKDADIETWTSQLDSLISDALDAKMVWNRIRVSLVEQGIETKTLLRVEDQYVRAIQSKDPNFGSLGSILIEYKVPEPVSGVLQGLAASTIFHLIVGS